VADSQGNPVSNVSVTVTVNAIQFTGTGSTGIKGNVFFPVVFKTPGNYAISASTSGGLTASTSIRIDYPAGTPAHMVFTTQPVNTYGGNAFAIAVQVTDYLNNPVNGAVVTITSLPTGAASATATTSTGVAQFPNFVFTSAGTFKLTATTSNNITAVSNQVIIDPFPASQLKFSVQPSNTTAGATMAPIVVQVLDTNGNMIHYTVPVTLISQMVAGPTGQVSTTVNATGSATFSNVVVTQAAAYSFIVQSYGTINGATSNTINIVPAADFRMVFKVQPPATAVVGVPLSPAVVIEVQDKFGNRVTESGRRVTLTGPNNGSQSGDIYVTGQVSVLTSGGQAIFKNIAFTNKAPELSSLYLVANGGTDLPAIQSNSVTLH
jgi:hypothetical protein